MTQSIRRGPRGRLDNIDALPTRTVRQVLTAAVAQSRGEVWRLAGRRDAMLDDRREARRLINGAERRIWAAEAQFWAKAGQTATDARERLRWHKTLASDLPRSGADPALIAACCGELRREAGFITKATELSRLRRLLRGGRGSQSGLTWLGDTEPASLMRLCPSPHRWERWLAKVRTRAARILRPWDCSPSWRALVQLLGTCRRLPPVGKAAIALAGATLLARFGVQQVTPGQDRPYFNLRGVTVSWPHTAYPRVGPLGIELAGPAFRVPAVLMTWWRVIAALRIHRTGATSHRPDGFAPVRVSQADLDEIGPQSQDDRLTIRSPILIARAPKGMVIADRDLSATRWRQPGSFRPAGRVAEAVVQVVVRNPANGERCHLTVPPQFGLPLWEGESAAARVHAAVSWTFSLTPAEYQPGVET